jgi:hypothetical protein
MRRSCSPLPPDLFVRPPRMCFEWFHASWQLICLESVEGDEGDEGEIDGW